LTGINIKNRNKSNIRLTVIVFLRKKENFKKKFGMVKKVVDLYTIPIQRPAELIFL